MALRVEHLREIVTTPVGLYSSRAPPFGTLDMSLPSRTITEGSPYSAFAMLLLATSRAVTNTVAPWPSPELSIGHSCSPLGRNKCWEVIGPALAVSVDILKAVKGLLDSRAEYLHDQEPKTCFISFGVYMLGRDESRANPTLLISCERKPPRQKAVKLIRESSVLKYIAGFRLADSSRLPLCSLPPVPLGPPGSQFSRWDLDPAITGALYSPVTGDTCGISLFTKLHSNDDGIYSRLATVGGFVCIQDTLYGLSTVHSFVGYSSPQAPLDDEIESEFEFDDELEGEDNNDNQISSAEKSQAQIPVLQQRGSTTKTRPDFGFNNLQFGKIKASSLSGGNIGLDWALIKAHPPLPPLNSLTIDRDNMKRIINIKKISDHGPVARSILAITGTSGALNGIMSPSPSFMLMPYGNYFQELWTVRISGDILPGDSGSWVIDCETGELYGHIVSGHPGFGIAYIIPAKHIAQDVENTFGHPMSLPQTPPATTRSTEPSNTFATQLISEPPISGVWESLSDIIIIVKACRAIYRKCEDAGGEFLEISRELRGLHTILRHLKYELEAPESPICRDRSIWGRQFAPVVGDADLTLRQLDRLLLNHSRVQIKPASVSRLILDNIMSHDEADQLGAIKAKLISHKISLTAFLNTIQQLDQSGKMVQILDNHGNQLDVLLDKGDSIAVGIREELSTSYDQKAWWKQFHRELVAEGFSFHVLQQHKDVLQAYIREVDHSGHFDKSPPREEIPKVEDPSLSALQSKARLRSDGQTLGEAEEKSLQGNMSHHEETFAPSPPYAENEADKHENNRNHGAFNSTLISATLISTRDLERSEGFLGELDTVFEEEAAPQPTLQEVLSNIAPPPWTLSALTTYASKSYYSRLLEFTKHTETYTRRFKRMKDSHTTWAWVRRHVTKFWHILSDTYIAPKSLKEVPLPSDIRDHLLQLPSDTPPDPEELNPAISLVYELIDESIFIPFKNSIKFSRRLKPDSNGNRIPWDAKWTKIDNEYVSLQVLQEDGRRYELFPDSVVIHGDLSLQELITIGERSLIQFKAEGVPLRTNREREADRDNLEETTTFTESSWALRETSRAQPVLINSGMKAFAPQRVRRDTEADCDSLESSDTDDKVESDHDYPELDAKSVPSPLNARKYIDPVPQWISAASQSSYGPSSPSESSMPPSLSSNFSTSSQLGFPKTPPDNRYSSESTARGGKQNSRSRWKDTSGAGTTDSAAGSLLQVLAEAAEDL